MDFWKVLEYTLSVATVGLLIWLVKLIFHDKLDARWHYFIWLVLLVRLILPVDFSLIRTPVSVFQGIPIGRWIEFGRLWVSRRGYEGIIVMLGKVYLWGALLLGGYYFVIWAMLRISVKYAPKADESTWEYVRDIAAKYGLKGCNDIRICKCSTPYICGLICPVLVLPEDNVRPEEPIIVHELLHRKWKDVAVNIGLHAVRAANWFNPVVWFLTSMVQNDSEALCDQRVLEYYGGDMEKDYGEMLLAMTRNKRRNPVKTGTSNMAGSYRNMRTRIGRICDFHRVPQGIGLVAFCITLMLAVSGIGASAEVHGFKTAEFETEAELQRELWKAQLYHARTPEEAIYLFLRAAAEQNVFYRVSVLPEERVEEFEELVGICWQQGYLDDRGIFSDSGNWQSGEMGAYFPKEINEITDWQLHRIYNLQYDENQGTATVFARLRCSREGSGYAEWKLTLTKEDGWKVWIAGDNGGGTGEYQEPPLFCSSTQIGDFVLGVEAYNEAYFDILRLAAESASGSRGMKVNVQGTQEADTFPDSFSMEYRVAEYYITYVGEESLAGHFVRVEITEDGKEMPAEILNQESEDTADSPYGFYGDGYVIAGFDGSNLAAGIPYLSGGVGYGSGEAGQGWKPGDRIEAYVRIYVDDRLVEEGKIENQNFQSHDL